VFDRLFNRPLDPKLLSVFLTVWLGLLAVWDLENVRLYVVHVHDKPFFTDFFAIWNWARFEIEQPPAQIYDSASRHAFMLSADPQYTAELPFPYPSVFRNPGEMPFPYPPQYLLLLRPLGWLSYPVAHVLWSATTLVAYVIAVCAPGWQPRTTLLALLAPVTTTNLVYGQNGFLTAALLIGGIRLAPWRPITGGILLGLLAYKPQFGLLIPIALAAAGMWRATFAAALAVAAAVAASLVAFGVEPWPAWIRAMPDFVALLDANRASLVQNMPTALANAFALGAGEHLAQIVQAAATVAAAAAVWIAFRGRPVPPAGNGRGAVLAVAAVLAAPYAFVYDLTLVAAAVALFAGERPMLSAGEVLVLAAAIMVPELMSVTATIPVAAAAHASFLALVLLRLGDKKGLRAPALRHVPATDAGR
jgi:alpha-1,2-mannosyltransferase